MRRFVLLALIACCAALPAYGFGTINRLGQHAEHEKITRRGLASFHFGPATMDAIAGKASTLGAVGAPDSPLRGLIFKSEAHCDNGDYLNVPGYPQSAEKAIAVLATCRAWIFARLDEAVSDAGDLVDESGRVRSSQLPGRLFTCLFNGRKGRAKCNVLEDLGLAFHTAQDFYSHTNWVDRPEPGPATVTNPPGLGHEKPASWIDPAKRDTAPPAGLISGCFGGIPESWYCNYGDEQHRVRHQDLNKDKGIIIVATGRTFAPGTPRGAVGGETSGNFARAVTAAVEDTRRKWAYFERRIQAVYGARRGKVIICAIRRDDASGCRP